MHTINETLHRPSRALKLLRRGGWLVLLALIVAPVLALAQGNSCPQFVQTALQTTDQYCKGTGRNQACYGHRLLDAQPQPGFEVADFAGEGDLVDLSRIQSLRLSAMDVETGTWGISLLRLQASLANALSARDITLLLFGDVAMENAETVSIRIPVTVAADQNINVRLGASDTAAVGTTLQPDQTVIARGRLADSSWLYVETPEGLMGWVYASLMTSEGDLETLTVLERSTPRYGPMQAFYLQTGAAAPTCAEAPDNGLLVQTPEGVAEVRLWINDVKIRLVSSSTSFIQADAGSIMTVNMLEGSGMIEAGGVTYPVIAGTQISIPLDDNLMAADAPSMPESSQPVNLPLDAMPNVGRPISQHVPFTEQQMNQFRERIANGEQTCGSDPYPACSVDETPDNSASGQNNQGGDDNPSGSSEGDPGGDSENNQGGSVDTPSGNSEGDPGGGSVDSAPGNSDGSPGGGNENNQGDDDNDGPGNSDGNPGGGNENNGNNGGGNDKDKDKDKDK